MTKLGHKFIGSGERPVVMMHEWFPNLVMKKCMESGHYPMLECPVYFASAVERFMSEET